MIDVACRSPWQCEGTAICLWGARMHSPCTNAPCSAGNWSGVELLWSPHAQDTPSWSKLAGGRLDRRSGRCKHQPCQYAPVCSGTAFLLHHLRRSLSSSKHERRGPSLAIHIRCHKTDNGGRTRLASPSSTILSYCNSHSICPSGNYRNMGSINGTTTLRETHLVLEPLYYSDKLIARWSGQVLRPKSNVDSCHELQEYGACRGHSDIEQFLQCPVSTTCRQSPECYDRSYRLNWYGLK